MTRPTIALAAGVAVLVAVVAMAQPELPTTRTTRIRPTAPAQPATPPEAPSTTTTPPPTPPSVRAGTPLTTPSEQLRMGWELEGVATSRDTPGVILSPLSDSLEIVEYRGSTDTWTRYRPGVRHGSTFVLGGALPLPQPFNEWYHQARSGEVVRRSGSVIIKNAADLEIQRFNFFEGWPRSLTIDPVSGTWQIEIVYEFMELG